MVKKQIVNECLDHLISKLEEDILFNIETYKYGKFSYRIINPDKTRRIEIKYDTLYSCTTLVDIDLYNYPKIVFFWYNKNNKENIRRLNKLYKLGNLRSDAKLRQDNILLNKTLIDCLPEDRQKNIYREAKLKRIIED